MEVLWPGSGEGENGELLVNRNRLSILKYEKGSGGQHCDCT